MAGRDANEHGLRDRVAEVLRDFVPAMRPGEVAWCADAVVTELGEGFAPEPKKEDFQARLVLAVVESLTEGDPRIEIAVGKCRITLSWGSTDG